MIHRYIYLLETVQLFSEKHKFIDNINRNIIIPKLNQSYIHFKYYGSGLGIISVGKVRHDSPEDENEDEEKSNNSDYEINYDYEEYFSIQIPANTIPVDLYNSLLTKSMEHGLLTE
jgi:hypothetical protein